MFRQCRIINRFIRNFRVPISYKSNNFRKLVKIGEVSLIVCTQTIYASKMGDESTEKLEDDITKAIQEGEVATINLMTQLKDFVVGTSEDYRKCIKQQIEIMRKASYIHAGPHSEVYDELPQYRTLANELKKQLSEHCALFNTLVNMAKIKNTELLKECKVGEQMTEFQALQRIVEKEMELNSKCEKELLQVFTDSILNEVLFGSVD
ncbi:unnamed protein product [Psylliodes chrysocephalus]|uniref:Uncharacterized protein n=1 Tax=Psylliodes chrysocephalus TaxID=3402493 RepID=A0A9P0CRI1_9CUCU|nr:unnamed protein product [Psylliodes chrysocephala]